MALRDRLKHLLFIVILFGGALGQEKIYKEKNDQVEMECRSGSAGQPGDFVMIWNMKTLKTEVFKSIPTNQREKYEITKTNHVYDQDGQLTCNAPGCIFTLVVKNLQVEDNGDYRCDITFEREETHPVIILDAPDRIYFKKGGDSKTYVENDVIPFKKDSNSTLSCFVENSYPVAVVNWEQMTEEAQQTIIHDNDTVPYVKTTERKLTFKPSVNKDTFTAVISIDHPIYQRKEISVKADVQYQPGEPVQFSVTERETDATNEDGNKMYSVKVDDAIRFRCAPTDFGNPIATLQLLHDGGVVTEKVTLLPDSILEFRPPKFEYSGKYGCRATNTMGTVNSAMADQVELTVIGVPASDGEALTGGAIAGIVVACVVVVLIVAAGAGYYFHRQMKPKQGDGGDEGGGGSGGAGKGAVDAEKGGEMKPVGGNPPSSNTPMKDPYEEKNGRSDTNQNDNKAFDSQLRLKNAEGLVYAELDLSKKSSSPPPLTREPTNYAQIKQKVFTLWLERQVTEEQQHPAIVKFNSPIQLSAAA